MCTLRSANPGIAQIYEAGTHGAEGAESPFFAMELVEDARDLVVYARDEELSVRERLALFLALCDAVHGAGGRALLVGGCVRDAVLGVPASDLDVEVYGIDPAKLIDLLEGCFQIDLVGANFGIIKLRSNASKS